MKCAATRLAWPPGSPTDKANVSFGRNTTRRCGATITDVITTPRSTRWPHTKRDPSVARDAALSSDHPLARPELDSTDDFVPRSALATVLDEHPHYILGDLVEPRNGHLRTIRQMMRIAQTGSLDRRLWAQALES